MRESCIVDNWSIFLVSEFFKNYPVYLKDIQNPPVNKDGIAQLGYLSKYFGALSNIINGLVFYDKILFLETGYEDSWKTNNYFNENYSYLFSPQKAPEEYLNIYDKNSYSMDTKFYILVANELNSDLFISPYRSDEILNYNNLTIPSVTNNLIKNIDEKISEQLKYENDSILKFGIESNQILPSLTQFVLNESNCMGDIFQTAQQIKESGYVQEYKNKVAEIVEGNNVTENYIKLKRDIECVFEDTICKLGIKKQQRQQLCEASFKMLIFEFSKISLSNPIKVKRENKYTILLKNIAKYRLEMYNSINTLKRIMKQ